MCDQTFENQPCELIKTNIFSTFFILTHKLFSSANAEFNEHSCAVYRNRMLYSEIKIFTEI